MSESGPNTNATIIFTTLTHDYTIVIMCAVNIAIKCNQNEST